MIKVEILTNTINGEVFSNVNINSKDSNISEFIAIKDALIYTSKDIKKEIDKQIFNETYKI